MDCENFFPTPVFRGFSPLRFDPYARRSQNRSSPRNSSETATAQKPTVENDAGRRSKEEKTSEANSVEETRLSMKTIDDFSVRCKAQKGVFTAIIGCGTDDPKANFRLEVDEPMGIKVWHLPSRTFRRIDLSYYVGNHVLPKFKNASAKMDRNAIFVHVPLESDDETPYTIGEADDSYVGAAPMDEQIVEAAERFLEADQFTPWRVVRQHTAVLDGKTLEFVEYMAPKDNDCALHCLGMSRIEAAQQLLDNMENSTIRHMIAPEIFEAFVGLELPDSMMCKPEWQNFYMRFNELDAMTDQAGRALREKLIELGVSEAYVNNATPYELCLEFDHLPESAQMKQSQECLQELEQAILEYCESREVFRDFVEYCVSRPTVWLGYLVDHNNNSRTSSIDALAFLNQKQVRIWVADHEANQLKLVHSFNPYAQPNIPGEQGRCLETIDLLHTDCLTHFNLLKPVN